MVQLYMYGCAAKAANVTHQRRGPTITTKATAVYMVCQPYFSYPHATRMSSRPFP
jgi:hypothetical protein